MDCSVIPSKKYKDMFVVSTTDFFYPLVEDPYLQGRIACANVLSDMYAMGVPDIDNVLMLLAASSDMKEGDREICTKLMIRGFNDQCKMAETQVSGGQSIVNPWPIIGGVAKTICKNEDIIMPRNAVAGDVIILTKPLGTQVAVNVKQWSNKEAVWTSRVKETISRDMGMRAYRLACENMCHLNRNASKLMHKHDAHAATDITGFGIMGHANNLASNQIQSVSFRIHTLPIIKGMVQVDKVNNFKLLQGLSAETSGGLFICLPKECAQSFIKELREIDDWQSWIVGDVIEGDRKAFIVESPTIVDI